MQSTEYGWKILDYNEYFRNMDIRIVCKIIMHNICHNLTQNVLHRMFLKIHETKLEPYKICVFLYFDIGDKALGFLIVLLNV